MFMGCVEIVDIKKNLNQMNQKCLYNKNIKFHNYKN